MHTLAIAAALSMTSSLQLVQQPDQSPGERYAEQYKQRAMDGGMDRWMQSLQPTLGHEVIAQFAGDWDYSVKMWWDQEQPPMETSWSGSAQPVMGGKFIEMTAAGDMMGQPFEGLYMVGYDNVRQLFHLTSFSSMDTSVQTLWGNLDREGTTLTFVGEMNEPISGEIGKSYMMTWTLDHKDQWTQRVYEILYGERFMVIESVATRKQ